MSLNTYPFLQNAENLISYLQKQTDQTRMHLTNSNVFLNAKKSYEYYYNRQTKSANNQHGLKTAGEQDEFVLLATNHFRNIILHTLSITTQNRLVFDCQAESTDVSARNSTVVGNLLLDQLFYEKQIDKQINRVVELGLIMGTSFCVVGWNEFDKLIGIDGSGTHIYTGAPEVKAYSIFDVVCSPHKDDERDQQWMQVREKANRWDLIALFPHKEKELLKVPRITDIQQFDPFMANDEDHIYLYKVYHKETPALPQGRMLWYCEESVVLVDERNPYLHDTTTTPNGGLPIFCFRPAIQYGSYAGYTIAFDLMALQESMNLLDSSIITNQQNFAVQNIAVCKQANVKPGDITGGCKLLEYDVVEGAPAGGKPESLQLCQTPAEVFNFRNQLAQEMEVISAVNSVLRGQPQASLLSGTALALVATQANTFNSTLEGNYVRFVESIAHFLLHIMSKFQKTEDLVSLIGKGRSNEIRSFKGDDLAPIRKVKVSLGNPLARSTAGKLELAEKLLSAGLIKTPQEFLEVIQTGNLAEVMENETAEIAYIKWENESFLRGENPVVIATDNHPLHILEHRSMTFNPDVRKNPQFHQQLLAHLTQHLDSLDDLSRGNPTLLSICLGMPVQLPQPNPETGVGAAAQPQETNIQPGDVSKVGQAPLASQSALSQQDDLAQQALQTASTQIAQATQQ